jgi:hypothetical protein
MCEKNELESRISERLAMLQDGLSRNQHRIEVEDARPVLK